MKEKLAVAFLLFFAAKLQAQNIISEKRLAGSFPVVTATGATPVLFDEKDDSLVLIATEFFRKDIEMITGRKPPVSSGAAPTNVIIIGSIQNSAVIQQLIKSKKLDVSKLQAKWEGYQIQIVKAPYSGVDQALVIVGSDRRGTAFGVFELSKQIGVSPWYWWADVPVKKKKEIYVTANALLSDAPKVKYRGIFINDEAPALSEWSKEKFGGFNHQFYEKVFELMLRLKSNYLWPAMWGNAFYDDDSLNIHMADRYGIVIGTSHHEPLMRAHDEWRRFGTGKWNYDSNATRIKQFWKSGMQRATNEKIVSVGMRGDGDEPMSRETATALLEKIVADQRRIITDVTGKPAEQTPQLWALYKEVQDYYDKGMRVPDDVTLLLCDDNWGNLRKLPKLTDKPRSGGYGIYYHFDYVGGPRNYKWLNTNNLARVWEQMHLAYEHGVDRIWIVNVGDIKPMELPVSFFLDYAWNPDKWNEDNLRSYYTAWASQQFGPRYATGIGDLLRKYSQMSARRKPELLDDKTYSLSEIHGIAKEWNETKKQAQRIYDYLPQESKDAFFQLVLHPIEAVANLHEMYRAVAMNKMLASQSNTRANFWGDKAKEYYQKDSAIMLSYHSIQNGKWNHMMSQTHIGYTYWQQPPVNKLPNLTYFSSTSKTGLPDVDDGNEPVDSFDKTAEHLLPRNSKGNIFLEINGIVSLEAKHWTKATNSQSIKWKTVLDIGRTGSGITTFPVTASTALSANSPHVDYEFYSYDSGKTTTHLYFSPTLNLHSTEEGLQFAVSIDNEAPQIFSLNKEDKTSSNGVWNQWVADNIIIKKSNHTINKPGKHTLKYWMISPGVVLQKLVVDFGGVKPSYLGPPETRKE